VELPQDMLRDQPMVVIGKMNTLTDTVPLHCRIFLLSNYNKKYSTAAYYKKLSYCWETMRRKSMPRIAEMDVEMTT